MTHIDPRYFIIHGNSVRDPNYTLIKKSGIHGCTGVIRVLDHSSYMIVRASKKNEEIDLETYNKLINT
jgi:hypothetical protein